MRAAAVTAVFVVAVGGCSSNSSDGTSGPTAPAEGGSSSSGAAGDEASPGAESSAPAVTAPADEVSTADRSAAPPASPVRLTAITARASDGSEEIVIATAGGVPGWRIRYVDVVRVEEEPVLVAGEAVLEIVLAAADPSGEEGLAPEVAVDALVDQPIVRELRFVRYLAGEVTLAVGLTEQVPFTVSATADSVVVTLQT